MITEDLLSKSYHRISNIWHQYLKGLDCMWSTIKKSMIFLTFNWNLHWKLGARFFYSNLKTGYKFVGKLVYYFGIKTQFRKLMIGLVGKFPYVLVWHVYCYYIFLDGILKSKYYIVWQRFIQYRFFFLKIYNKSHLLHFGIPYKICF